MSRAAASSRRSSRSATLVLTAAVVAAPVLGVGCHAATAMADDMRMVLRAAGSVAPGGADMEPQPAKTMQESPELQQVLSGVMCRCGCNLTVEACQGTMTCDVAGRMRAEAERKLATGMTPAQVLDSFAHDYGEQVLAAPTKRGFNLTAWILPFVALLVGGAAVVFALRSWRPGVADDAPVPQADPKYLAEVEEELSKEE